MLSSFPLCQKVILFDSILFGITDASFLMNGNLPVTMEILRINLAFYETLLPGPCKSVPDILPAMKMPHLLVRYYFQKLLPLQTR